MPGPFIIRKNTLYRKLEAVCSQERHVFPVVNKTNQAQAFLPNKTTACQKGRLLKILDVKASYISEFPDSYPGTSVWQNHFQIGTPSCRNGL